MTFFWSSILITLVLSSIVLPRYINLYYNFIIEKLSFQHCFKSLNIV
nr:MAG TPA: hypothetical protein [Caudoviricetes sp.]